MLIQKLKAIFLVDTDAKLSKVLGVKTETLSDWYRKERSGRPLPGNIRGLLSLIHDQQEEILRLRKKLKENKEI